MPLLRNQKTPIQKLRNFFEECNTKVSRVRRAEGNRARNIKTNTDARADFVKDDLNKANPKWHHGLF